VSQVSPPARVAGDKQTMDQLSPCSYTAQCNITSRQLRST